MTKETKKYYWIKLKTDFFNQETIDFLLSQKNGCEYIVLYQMLCLQTANKNGTMATIIGERIVPYDINKIVRDTKYFDYDTVAVALELFKQLELIYEEDNKVLRIANLDAMVGSETTWAEKKRIYRNKQKLELGHKKDNVLEDIEIEKDIDKDNNKLKENIKRKYFDDEELNALFNEFLDLRIKLKAKNTDRAITLLLNELNKWDKETKMKMLNNSIMSSWKSVYPLKKSKSTSIEPEWLDKEIKFKVNEEAEEFERRFFEELEKEQKN